VLSFVGFVVYGASNAAFAHVMKLLIDSIQAGERREVFFPLLIIGLFAARGIGSFLGTYSLASIAKELVHDLQLKLYDTFVAMPASRFDEMESSTLISKVTYGVGSVADSVTTSLKTLLQEGLINEHFRQGMVDMIIMLMPVLGALMVASIGPTLLLGGWNFTLNPIGFKFNKLNPGPGIKRMFSVSAVMEGGKAVLKSALIGGISTWVIWLEMGQIIQLITLPLDESITRMMELTVHTTLIVVSSLLLLVAIDVPFQWWNFRKGLRMTKEEMKQEHKTSEGSPEVKGRIRQLQREAARKRMMSAVPSADVIVTNPTHFAVALAYKSGMGAPKVLAKGVGEIALKIREVGAANGVPMLEAPPLARALYRHTELDQEIPSALYSAVAEVMAYVYQLGNWRKVGGHFPLPPREIAVPAELVPAELSHG